MASVSPCVETNNADSRDADASDLAREVRERVMRSSYVALRKVMVVHDGSTVTLQGIVPSQFLKQVAQTIAHQVAGVRAVVNHLDVGE